MRKQLGVLFLIIVFSQLVFGYGSGTSDSTHLKLTNVLFDAAAPANLINLVLNRAEYPDVYKFKQAILDGANSETAHHDPADTNTEYWFANEGLWENLVRASQYPTKSFRSAYKSIGYFVHLTEDSTIPAHERVIFHGYPTLYYVAPGGSLLDNTKYTTVRSDGLEFAAGDHDLSTLQPTDVSLFTFHSSPGMWINTPQYYNSSSATCQNVMRKLWLCSGEAAAAGHPDNYSSLCSAPEARSWGVYSFPTARGCDYPPVGGDLDWYPRRLYPSGGVEAPQNAHEMGRAAVYLAIRLSSEALKRFSQSLPPVVTSPSSRIVGDFAGGVATAFFLHVQDNRTQGVYLTVRDTATGRNIRATISAPGLPVTTTDLDGRLRIPLSRQSDLDLTILPWADQLSITWDGQLAGGVGRIGAGNQTLQVEARDEDGIVGTGVVLIGGSTSGVAITQQPASLTVTEGQTATFTVTVSGSGPFSYQWAKNGAAIAGATGSSYTTPATTAVDNGASFFVTASSTAGGASSAIAILTVVTAQPPTPTQAQDLIANGGFESGAASWSGDTSAIGTFKTEPAYAGTKNALLMGNGRTSTEALYQRVTIPDTATSATLSFYLHIHTAETTTRTVYDKLYVQVRDTSGSVLQTLATYSNLDAASGYTLRSLDVTAYRGQTVRIHFKGSEDRSLATSFVIDNVSLLRR